MIVSSYVSIRMLGLHPNHLHRQYSRSDEKKIYDYLFIITNEKEVCVSREYLRFDMIIRYQMIDSLYQ